MGGGQCEWDKSEPLSLRSSQSCWRSYLSLKVCPLLSQTVVSCGASSPSCLLHFLSLLLHMQTTNYFFYAWYLRVNSQERCYIQKVPVFVLADACMQCQISKQSIHPLYTLSIPGMPSRVKHFSCHYIGSKGSNVQHLETPPPTSPVLPFLWGKVECSRRWHIA